MDLKLYFFIQIKGNPFLVNYKILISLLMINLILEKEVRKLSSNDYEIQLVIQGKGEQELLYESFETKPYKVLVNGIEKKCSKTCYLIEDKNNVTLIFKNSLQTTGYMFTGLKNILEIDLSNFNLNINLCLEIVQI